MEGVTNAIELSTVEAARGDTKIIRTASRRLSDSIPKVAPPSRRTSMIDAEMPQLTRAQRKQEWIQLYALFWCTFQIGWSDGTTGPLLPTYKSHYNLSYSALSLIFVISVLGSISCSLYLVLFSHHYGFGKTIVLASVLLVMTTAIQASEQPYPVMLVAFFFNGFGNALEGALANSFVACLHEKVPKKLGLIHAFYGAGAFCAPLVSTQFSQRKHWTYHYLTSFVIACISVVTFTLVFKFKRQEDLIAVPEGVQRDTPHLNQHSYGRILKSPLVHMLACFTLIYVGVEVTTGGWIVTYIIRERGGGPSAGYISSGFFGGLALGRILLLWLNEKVGEYRVIYIYSVIALVLELVVWLTHSLIGNAIAVSIIGLLLGPMYPIMVHHAGRILPRSTLTGSIGWIGGFGAGGSALIPFITGTLAGKFGIIALEPLLIAMICIMVVLWAFIPSREKRMV